MTARTLVVVYAVDGSGATAERLGAATLIEPDFVLVHPPLNHSLAQQPRAARVGVFTAPSADGEGDGRTAAEVIDVARVRVVPEAPDLVLLELAVMSAAPPHGVPVELREDPTGKHPFLEPTRAEIIAAARSVLAEAPAPTPDLAPIANPIRWVIQLFGG